MQANPLKQKLSDGKYTCGSWVSLCSPLGAEVMGMVGFDWLLIDMEHGSGDIQTLIHQLQGIAAAGATVPIVRVPWNDPVVIKRVLDAGAMGVMVPGVRTVAEAEQAIAATRFAPEGIRGVAANTRAARFGLDGEFLATANDQIALFLQIENREAVDNIDPILDLPGIDVAFIGPNDLSSDMGHRGNAGHADVQAAIALVEQAANARHIPLGTVSRNWEGAAAMLDKGYRAMSIMGDIPLMLQAAQSGVSNFREHPRVAGK